MLGVHAIAIVAGGRCHGSIAHVLLLLLFMTAFRLVRLQRSNTSGQWRSEVGRRVVSRDVGGRCGRDRILILLRGTRASVVAGLLAVAAGDHPGLARDLLAHLALQLLALPRRA
jgi:hypothetical protein